MQMSCDKLNIQSWLLVPRTPHERIYTNASTNAKASYPNTESSCGFFAGYALYAPPKHISFHTQLQLNMFCVPKFALVMF